MFHVEWGQNSVRLGVKVSNPLVRGIGVPGDWAVQTNNFWITAAVGRERVRKRKLFTVLQPGWRSELRAVVLKYMNEPGGGRIDLVLIDQY